MVKTKQKKKEKREKQVDKHSLIKSLFKHHNKNKKVDEEDLLDVDELEDEDEKQPRKGGEVNLGTLKIDLERISARVESLKEMRTAFSEKMSFTDEQIGELRSMMVERDRDLKELEGKAIKAVELVEAVHPDKFMVELRREDGKIEAVKANLENNEEIMNRIINELKEVRNKMSLFRGTEQVMKLNEEVRAELIGIKKLEAINARHANKVETIFMEMEKRFKEFEKIKDDINDFKRNIKSLSNDIEALKVKFTETVTKDDINNLTKAVDAIKKENAALADNVHIKVDSLYKEINSKLSKYEKDLNKKFDKKLKVVRDYVEAVEQLKKESPDLVKDLESLKKILKHLKF